MTTERGNYRQSQFNGRLSLWQKKADDHKEKQLINPFSEWEGASHRAVLSKDDPDYGRPVAGSLTERRGQQASKHINAAIVELCHIIATIGNFTVFPDNFG